MTQYSLVGLGLLVSLLLGALAELLATPATTELISLLAEVLLVDDLDESSELGVISRVDLLEGNSGGSLLVDELSKTSLALDNGVWHAHATAESGQPDDDLKELEGEVKKG